MTKHLGLQFQKSECVARAEFPCAAVADVDAVVDPEGIPGAVEVERTSGFTVSQPRPALVECERCQREKMLGQAGSNPRRHDRPMTGKLAPDVREGHLRGVVPALAASATVTPAAWPIAMDEAWTRSAELAIRSLLTQRPATLRFLLSLGISALRGTVGTMPSFK